MECTDCNGKLPKNGNYVHCHACGGDYHYTCTSLSEKSYKSMSKPKKLEWKCLECRKINASQMSAKSSTRKKSESENSDCESDISDFLARRTRKSKVHDNEKVSDKSMEQLFEQFENRLWKKMSKKLSDIEEFMGFASSKIDDFSKLMKDIQKKQVTMEVAQEKLRQENMELKSKCKALEIGLNENAQLFNRNKLEITNIPTTVANPNEVVAKVLEKVNGEKIDEKSYGTEVRKFENQVNVVVQFESVVQHTRGSLCFSLANDIPYVVYLANIHQRELINLMTGRGHATATPPSGGSPCVKDRGRPRAPDRRSKNDLSPRPTSITSPTWAPVMAYKYNVSWTSPPLWKPLIVPPPTKMSHPPPRHPPHLPRTPSQLASYNGSTPRRAPAPPRPTLSRTPESTPGHDVHTFHSVASLHDYKEISSSPRHSIASNNSSNPSTPPSPSPP
ncbi:hypothetical protein M8J76_007941 [Diaphorina citri]|nr:hypothetical protein M8J76_007941 [Diaphorina citri]